MLSRLIDKDIKVYCISDLHTDYKHNMQWWEDHPLVSEDHHNILIIAGDISHNLTTLRKTLRIATLVYNDVFFIPGNHDLWCFGEYKSSIEKLKAVLSVCDEIGVMYQPVRYKNQNIVIFPLFSWYSESWDTETNINNPKETSLLEGWNDFQYCSWPTTDIESYFSQMNVRNIRDTVLLDETTKMITFSHFLPLQELLPEKRFLIHSYLPKVVGSNVLMRQIQEIGPNIHIFGHSHLPMDTVIDGIRYVQWSLGNVRERSLQCKPVSRQGPLCVYENGCVGEVVSTYWGDFYRSHKRDPDNKELAPWVRAFWESR